MAKRDYYELLGVPRDVNAADLKSAYRRIAMRNHPDRNPDNHAAEERLKDANEAYGVLSDAEQRGTYDRFGHDGLRMAQQGGGGGGGGGAGIDDIFGDIFGSVFRDADFGGTRRQPRQQGRNLKFSLRLDLEKAAVGCSERVTLPSRPVVCSGCEGSGAAPGGGGATDCRHCGGSGAVRRTQGIFTMQQTCGNCGGSGLEIRAPCGSCAGSGRVNQSETVSVSIPAGVSDGDELRLHGKGEAGVRGAPAGDLFIKIQEAPHEMFQREGAHLRCEATVSITEAALGSTLELPMLGGGTARAKLKAGTQSGDVLRLRGKGVRTLRRATPGDLLCRVIVEVPRNLNEQQQQLLRDLADSLGHKTHCPQRSSWLQRLKQHFAAK